MQALGVNSSEDGDPFATWDKETYLELKKDPLFWESASAQRHDILVRMLKNIARS